MSGGAPSAGRVRRLAETDRAALVFGFDGAAYSGLDGDTVLTAVLAALPDLRAAEFGPERRAGFCLMGACQDCWLWQEDGPRLRACSTPLRAGMRLRSSPPDDWPGTLP
ncbi:(2Fe-2S)-binding protein [Roseovarius nitratireducens]|uniref:(2Fe-2S)-binding protein n=1 Tax=Roseovarius nitratireducens TaxID=2044597 RepID=UPI000CE1A3D8|nr:(2Fe-2S)-binding protein [Roseovarius nitratireducens]